MSASRRLLISPRAAADHDEIAEYIARDNFSKTVPFALDAIAIVIKREGDASKEATANPTGSKELTLGNRCVYVKSELYRRLPVMVSNSIS